MRRSRLRRGLATFGLVLASIILVAAAAWTTLNVRYSRLLESELSSLRADGFALTVAAARPQPVPEAENAARIYLPLFQVNFERAQGQPGTKPNGGLNRFRIGKTDVASVLAGRQIIESPEAQAALARLRQASQMPYCVFPVKWEQGFSALFPHLAQIRQAARLVAAQAILKGRAGKLTEALDWLVVSYRMADQAAEEPSLIAQLVAYATRAIANQAARDIITGKDVPPAAGRRLYDELATVEVYKPYAAAMRMEVAQGLDFTRKWRHSQDLSIVEALGGDPPPALMFVIGLTRSPLAAPLVKLEEFNYARYMHRLVPGSVKPYREATSDTSPEIRPGIGTVMSSILIPVVGKATARRDQSLTEVRLLQVVLALKACRHQHGSYPASLSELPWQPATEDPFSGRPFVYAPSGEGFRLYSVGPNLKDDGGREPSKPSNISQEGDMVWVCER